MKSKMTVYNNNHHYCNSNNLDNMSKQWRAAAEQVLTVILYISNVKDITNNYNKSFCFDISILCITVFDKRLCLVFNTLRALTHDLLVVGHIFLYSVKLLFDKILEFLHVYYLETIKTYWIIYHNCYFQLRKLPPFHHLPQVKVQVQVGLNT